MQALRQESSGGGVKLSKYFKIVVIAHNSAGYSVKHITQSTGEIAPELRSLEITDTDGDSITLKKPAFSIAGNPLPTVKAYIGVKGTIKASGSTVTGNTGSEIDATDGDANFTGLTEYTPYTIIVVAQNTKGYSVKQIDIQDPDGLGIAAPGQSAALNITGGLNKYGFQRLWRTGDTTGEYTVITDIIKSTHNKLNDEGERYYYFGDRNIYFFWKCESTWYLVGSVPYTYNASDNTITAGVNTINKNYEGIPSWGRLIIDDVKAQFFMKDDERFNLLTYQTKDSFSETVTSMDNIFLDSFYNGYIDETLSLPSVTSLNASYSNGEFTIDYNITAPDLKEISYIQFSLISQSLYEKEVIFF